MSTALAPQTQQLPSAADWDAQRNFAALLCRSSFIPAHYQGKPENVLWAMQMARAYHVDFAYYMDCTFPLPGGKNGHYVRFKLGLAKDRCPDFEYEIVENSNVRCVLEGWRGKGQRVRVEFTMEQAKRAKLAGKDTYQNYGEDMLFNRAMSRLVDRVCPDYGIAIPRVVTDADDEDEAPARSVPVPGTPAAAERSEAVVVEDAAPTPAAPPPPADVEAQHAQQLAANAAARAAHDGAEKMPVPEDWQGRLLRAVAKHYDRTEPGTHKNAYAKWIKANGADLGKLVNLYYAEKGLKQVKTWPEVPPMDYEAIAKWLENRSNGAGAEGSPSGGTDAAPATPAAAAEEQVVVDWLEAEGVLPAPEDEPDTEAEPEPRTGYLALIDAGHLRVTTLLLSMRHATKGEREFVEKSAKTSQYALKDGAILKECGFTNGRGTPIAQWMHKLQEGIVWDGEKFLEPSEAVWPMTCRAIYDTAVGMKVATEV